MNKLKKVISTVLETQRKLGEVKHEASKELLSIVTDTEGETPSVVTKAEEVSS